MTQKALGIWESARDQLPLPTASQAAELPLLSAPAPGFQRQMKGREGTRTQQSKPERDLSVPVSRTKKAPPTG